MTSIETEAIAGASRKIPRRLFLKQGVLSGAGLLFTACGLMQERPLPGRTPEPKANTGGGNEPFLPQVTATAEPTKVPPTATEVAKKVEKSPLPTYGVFSGTLPDGRGNIVIASIPTSDTKDEIFANVWIVSPNTIVPRTYTTIPQNINGLTFQVNQVPDKPSLNRMQITVSEDGKTLTGRFESGIPGRAIDFETEFTAELTGNGKQEVIKDIKLAKIRARKMSDSSLPTVNIDEIKRMVDFDKFPD